MKVFLNGLALKTTMVVAARTNATDAGTTIAKSIQWFITGGGLLMAVWGIVQLTQSGRSGDSQGKMEGSWLVVGGVLLMAIGAGSMLSGVFSNPPGA
ncbi:hypothetical protein [Candidatus Enterococcus ikei]|uniref:Conjugal transfer protein TrbC n=1 Tax=Candidatus Enterococcus ikei TaxID=2815326 RepID=A0ABS3H1X9_9ENTE|nr:hypothetical protein [Enterococcus sp. DIV0869a]MBO0441538.1 hypothetical protein [Enterococcus sp. DIV0869a]